MMNLMRQMMATNAQASSTPVNPVTPATPTRAPVEFPSTPSLTQADDDSNVL
jgi:hypothetical protein